MRTQTKLIMATAIIAIVTAAVPVTAVQVTLSSFGTAGQTRILRGEISGLGLASVDTVTVTDIGSGGADGVFSGFDLDFLLLDLDGDFSTTGDQTAPFLTAATTVTPGTIMNQGTSPYQPTGAHPGDLFGLNVDDSIDFATATIGERDAFFVNPLAVNTSGGWVTLGYGGVLTATFPATGVGDSLWVFLGEVGTETTEAVSAMVDVTGTVIPAPGAILLGVLGTSMVTWLRRRRTL